MSDVDTIKSRIDIVDFIGKTVKLKKAGRNFKGLCPFHSEKTPSFMVSPDRQAFHCFGCGKGGSVFDFVMEYHHVDFREALEELAELTGVPLTRVSAVTPDEKKKETLLEIHHLASEYYQYLLHSHAVGENARAYVKDRGVSEKVIKTFGLGYAANSWDGVSKFLKKKGYEQDVLVASGLVVASSRGGYDRFRGRLMFPLSNHRGQIIGFSGRLLDATAKEAKYINSPETPLYTKGDTLFALNVTKRDIQREDSAVIMEGEFDVLSSFQAGIGNVVAIKGTAVTQNQVRLLARYAKKIIFALDSDVAGDDAARRGIELAEKAGLEIYIATLPQGSDPDDIARKNPHALKKAIEQAVSMYDYYISSAQKRFDMGSAYGKKRLGEELFPIFAKIENAIIQAHYIKKLSDLISLPSAVIEEGIRKASLQQRRGVSTYPQNAMPEQATKKDTQELVMLSLLLQADTKELFEDFKAEVPMEALSSGAVVHILKRLTEYISSTTHFFLKDFLDSLPSELQPTVDTAFLLDLGDIISSPEDLAKTWQVTIREIKKRYVKKRVNELSQKLKTLPEDESQAVEKEFSALASELRLLEKVAEL